MEKPPQRTIELTDPHALRALAHPTRLRLLTLLRTVGPMTASQAAERTGESAGSCSFHFRQLARWDLVEETGGGKGRERPWRATAAATSWSGVGRTAEADEAGRLFSRVVASQYHELFVRWLDARAQEPPDWRDAAGFGDVVLYLRAEELREVLSAMRAAIEDAARRTASREQPSPGARMVQLTFMGFPVEPPQGS